MCQLKLPSMTSPVKEKVDLTNFHMNLARETTPNDGEWWPDANEVGNEKTQLTLVQENRL